MPEGELTIMATVTSNARDVLPVSTVWSFVPEGVSRSVPPVLNTSQAYYWTRMWQQGEQEAVSELRRGQGRVFADPDDAIRWLLSTEED